MRRASRWRTQQERGLIPEGPPLKASKAALPNRRDPEEQNSEILGHSKYLDGKKAQRLKKRQKSSGAGRSVDRGQGEDEYENKLMNPPTGEVESEGE